MHMCVGEVCHHGLLGTKSLSKPMMTLTEHTAPISVKFESIFQHFRSTKCATKRQQSHPSLNDLNQCRASWFRYWQQVWDIALGDIEICIRCKSVYVPFAIAIHKILY